ncbi:MAG: site-specific integrase [Bacteroides sp.]
MKTKDLFFFMESLIRVQRSEQRFGTAHVYQSTLNRIRKYERSNKMPFSKLTREWIKGFEIQLRFEQLKENSISTYLRMLKAVYNQGVDRGLVEYAPRLFKHVYTGVDAKRDRSLEPEALQKLISPTRYLNTRLETTRSIFLLLLMLQGMPFVDLAHLRKCDLKDGVIVYRRHKTGMELSVTVDPKAMAIIEKYQHKNPDSPYLFPFVTTSRREGYRQYQNALREFNQSLSFLGKLLGLNTRLSSYKARHTWASLANFLGFDKKLISECMGHSSLKMTETYFKAQGNSRIKKVNQGVINYLIAS